MWVSSIDRRHHLIHSVHRSYVIKGKLVLSNLKSLKNMDAHKFIKWFKMSFNQANQGLTSSSLNFIDITTIWIWLAE